MSKNISREEMRAIFYQEPRPPFKIKKSTANRILYLLVVIAVLVFAWISGERIAYISAIVLVALPIVSLVVTLAMLAGLRVWQEIPKTVVKNQQAHIKIGFKNYSILPFSKVECTFITNKHAIETEDVKGVELKAFSRSAIKIPFKAIYRGHFQIGLKSIVVTDFVGLVTLRRNYRKKQKLIALPQVVDLTSSPLTMNLLAEASSPFDIKDEDYATISDVRPYVPTDSIKRVHWKLTAKRNEWMVKQFQSNGLNSVDIVVDSKRLPMSVDDTEMYQLEDKIVESAISLARFCLNKGMPVDFHSTGGGKTHASTAAFFDTIYAVAGDMIFEEKPPLSPVSVLSRLLNDAAGSVNAVIFTSQLDVELYERVVNATNRGNFVAVIYIAPSTASEEAERIFSLLTNGGLPCYKSL